MGPLSRDTKRLEILGEDRGIVLIESKEIIGEYVLAGRRERLIRALTISQFEGIEGDFPSRVTGAAVDLEFMSVSGEIRGTVET